MYTWALYEETFDFRKDEVLEVFFSNRFTPAALPQVIRDAGFDVRQAWVLDSQEEGIYLCRALITCQAPVTRQLVPDT